MRKPGMLEKQFWLRVFKMPLSCKAAVSLAPGLSPVWVGRADGSRFNGFPAGTKAAEAAGTAD
jgi:hypothetical protein